jgi:hypothetical protein
MNARIPSIARRAAALGLLGLLIASVWLSLVYPALEQINAAGERRGISLKALQRNRALLQQSPAIQAADASVSSSPRWRNFYRAAKPEVATLQMETDLRTLLRDSNNPTSMAAEPALVQGPVTQLGVRVTLSMRIDQLADALDRIQKEPHQLRLTRLTIQTPEGQAAQTNPQLTIQAEISGLMVADEPGRM